jgi:predicted metal-binding protein
MTTKPIDMKDLQTLIGTALENGATDAIAMETAHISVEDHLADRCREPRCGFYGQSRSCPPHVKGPSAMRGDLSEFTHAIFFRIEVPSESLFAGGQREIFQLLHETAAGIEKKAASLGYVRSKAFAGGSCKEVFCTDLIDCAVVSGKGPCRHPGEARPSMSGFGVNVSRLMEKAGWAMNTAGDGDGKNGMSSVSGLVLVG